MSVEWIEYYKVACRQCLLRQNSVHPHQKIFKASSIFLIYFAVRTVLLLLPKLKLEHLNELSNIVWRSMIIWLERLSRKDKSI